MADEQPTKNAHNFQDLTGLVVGSLTVLRRDHRDTRKKAFWVCRCECGKTYVTAAYYLAHGIRTHCGCQRGSVLREVFRKFHEQHPQPTAIAIALTNGMAAIVDEDDYPLVARYWWSAHRGTATTYARSGTGEGRILLHVLLMGEKEGHTIDHINGNGLDNRRENLRWATPHGQSRNIHGGRGRSQYKGVTWAKRQRRWSATIWISGKNQYLGYYDSEDDAARAYDAAAREHYGEFACLNFPVEAASDDT